MRVIAGTARRTPLKTVPGLATRPTTDRIKETLFNMLQPYLLDSVFLDLFSGSGAIGIEALSRGARRACFVEKDPAAMECIRQNLTAARLVSSAVCCQADVLAALPRLKQHGPFDIVFLDPPYHQNLESEVLRQIAAMELLAPEAILIVEAARDTAAGEMLAGGYRLVKEKEYKTNKHIFLTLS